MVHGPPETTLDNARQPIDVLIGEVAKLIGGSDDPDAKAQALISIDRAADWMNKSGIYLYNKRTKSYTSGDFSDGDGSLDLPTDWGWPHHPIIVYDENGARVIRGEWLEWEEFRPYIQDLDTADQNKGRPQYFSIRDEFQDAKVYCYPFIDSTQVQQIDVVYFKRVPRPSEVETLYISPETRECLIIGGEAFTMRFRYARNPNVWQPFWKQFQDSITLAKGVAHRRMQATRGLVTPMEEGDPRLHNINTPPGEVWIKI
jgi:hypothetical protein